ncbi:MAG: urate hydroxylase PuuD [Candidatus Eisenbacteria bacterium]|nr:urate hydroxylase PuuD [Candidatus Eisenbacteria bacterium]
MPAIVSEWLNILLRWTHIIAAIMWVGDSFLFMWMDRHLEKPSRPRDGDVTGELWMVHSGGFYEVVKRRTLSVGEIPERLHWFKWQAYTTWLSGIALLAVVYWFGGAVYLVDHSVSPLSAAQAVGLSAASLVAGWLLYDALWMSSLARRPGVAVAVSLLLLAGVAVGFTHAFSGRGAFLMTGAFLATIMAANVWRRIIPAQKQMMAATRAGKAADATLGARAKSRSTHNHYLTFPVVFCMLSNHFPSMYGHSQPAAVLLLFMTFGITFKYWMNFRGRTPQWILAAGVLSLLGLVGLTAPRPAGAVAGAGSVTTAVDYETARRVMERRCFTCHSLHPTNPSFPEPPSGVRFDEPERMVALAERIRVRAVETKTMPLGNLTGMTDEERDTLAAWIAAGAPGR